MKKKINHITEELIMRYVEGDLSHEENEKFNNILSKSEYLRKRVNTLKDMVISQPLDSPSLDTHNDILEKLNINNHEQSSKTGYFSEFFDKLTSRPIILASSVSCLVIALVIFSVNNNGTNANSGKIDNSISSKETEKSSPELVDKDNETDKKKDKGDNF